MQQQWPELPLRAWEDTYATLHRWMQIVGKVRLALAPKCNHWWHTTLYLTARGLTTSPIPFGGLNFDMDFDFIDHELQIRKNDGAKKVIRLYPRSVADFYREVMSSLRSLGMEISIWPVPVEIEDRIPFDQDEKHASYDSEYAHRAWLVLAQTDRVIKQFRSRFVGKVSPVHFFWGAFDLACTRFCGRRAPEHGPVPNLVRHVAVEAYSHEVSSCGFWPGAGLGEPAFYSYAYPEPAGFKKYGIGPKEAYYHDQFGEFLLPYDAVRKSASPDRMLLEFFQTTYDAASTLANWDRASLEANL
jgi:hypothetical protein